MGLFELLMIAVGLSMDAFAVALCKGLAMPKMNWRRAGVIALFFGGFQAAMPLLGWVMGRQFEKYITALDHWVAFVLLGFIGGKMIWEALREGEKEAPQEESMDIKEMFMLSIATSIDALAVGITFAFLEVNIMPSVAAIGVTTFLLSLLGVAAGNRFGALLMKKAEIAGGSILILIGIKILLEHLGVFT